MFTKSDLKTGMFGVMSNGNTFVVVNNHFVYESGGYDYINMNLAYCHVDKVYEGVHSFRQLKCNLEGECVHGTLVYKYEPPKPKYNGKVVCIENSRGNQRIYTVGKIYQFKDGILTCDDGSEIDYYDNRPFESFDEFDNFSSFKWIEIKE